MAEKKKVKRIKVDLEQCNGCRSCEMACSTFHALPKYSSTNPARSRIRVVMKQLNNEYVPVRSTNYTKAKCAGRRVYRINEGEFRECSFCGTICPSRDLFKDPTSNLPLKCDMCEEEPSAQEPFCVQACNLGALTYEEVDEEVEEEAELEEAELGLQALIDKYGVHKITDVFVRLAQNS